MVTYVNPYRDHMFYNVTPTNKKSHFVLTTIKHALRFVGFYLSAVWQHGCTKTLVLNLNITTDFYTCIQVRDITKDI